jgi:2-iminobutanoate/2-iminopropanoate deaminase
MLVKERITSPGAQDLMKTMSPALKVGNMVFCSGQVAIDPQTGNLINTSVEAELHQVMKNLESVLRASGADFDNVVKTTVFLSSLEDFPVVNELYGSYFKGVPPARSTIEVAGLYKGLRVEIEAIAIL